MRTSRREFLRMSAGSVGAVATGAALSACATVPVHPASVIDGRAVLDLADFDLWSEGRNAVLLAIPDVRWPVLLIRDDGIFRALTSRCTHQGCRVQPGGEFLRCTCHGSTFDLEGRVLRGPALEPLPPYPVKVAAGRVEIQLGASGGSG